jgi:Mrp family chromosome partitioning ATPase
MDPRSNAFVLSCARPVREPARVWQSTQFALLIAHLKKTCDLVIIDAPCASAPEIRPLMEAADGVVMVVARDRAHEPGIAQAVYAMAQLPTPMGIALAG